MNETILVVDDEASICQSLKAILLDEGYQVLVAGSGEEAIKIIDDELPNLVLLDIWLPGMDGMETLKAIKAEHPKVLILCPATAPLKPPSRPRNWAPSILLKSRFPWKSHPPGDHALDIFRWKKKMSPETESFPAIRIDGQ